MSLPAAPYFEEIAAGSGPASAHWLTASDGCRLRAGVWHPETSGTAASPMQPLPPEPVGAGDAGTLFLFPGRTEYLEKYGPTAREFTRRGYVVASIDWRGQGLADRLIGDPLLGHVEDFTDYQRDVAALSAYVEAQALPRPWVLLAHSMGGAIALRSLMAQAGNCALGVTACAFSAPMWGIRIPPLLKPAAAVLGRFGAGLGLAQMRVPTTTSQQYVQVQPFADNTLTSDPESYAFLQMQMRDHPELALGGPTVQWLASAMLETSALAALPSPRLPCLTFLGSDEQIVATEAIHLRMSRWPQGTLQPVEGARHELLLERAPLRAPVIDALDAHFRTNSR